MIGEVYSTIREFNMIKEGDNIVIGLSGGADSVCLFLNLVEYCREQGGKLIAVHIEHGIREDSDKDVTFCKELTDKYEIPLQVFHIDVPRMAREERLSLEEAGRKARYAAFREVLNKLGGRGVIATAQHRGDVAETMLHNICRGSSIKGLGGIRPVNGDIIRPLIRIGRKEIEEYLAKNNTSFCIDSTNMENEYTRNRIRNIVLPALEEHVNPRALEHIAAAAEDLREAEEYLDRVAENALMEICVDGRDRESFESKEHISISVKEISRLEPIIAKRVLIKLLSMICGSERDLSRTHIEALYELCRDIKGEKELNLPKGIKAIRCYETLTLAAFDLCRGARWNLEDKRVSSPKFSIINIEKDGIEEELIPRGKYTKWFDYDKIKGNAVFRSRQKGDYLLINQGGELRRKSLSDYMIDEKIPGHLRDGLPLLTDGSHVMWVLGGRCSDYYRIGPESSKILEVSIDKEREDV